MVQLVVPMCCLSGEGVAQKKPTKAQAARARTLEEDSRFAVVILSTGRGASSVTGSGHKLISGKANGCGKDPEVIAGAQFNSLAFSRS